MDNVHPEVAKRVGMATSADSRLGISFFRTFTSPHVEPAVEDHMVTIFVNKPALGELYIILKELVEKNPNEFGFKIAK